jgi:hypothetical protein
MQKSTTFTTIFPVKKYYFHYDFACKKVPLSLRYAKNIYTELSFKCIIRVGYDFKIRLATLTVDCADPVN